MEPGEKCICQYDDWYNAFGETHHVSRGMRLTVSGSRNVAGTSFYSFEETPKDAYFLNTGFVPLRSLN